MEIIIVRKDDNLEIVRLKDALSMSKNLARQIQILHRLDPEDLDKLEIIGWIAGVALDAHQNQKFALVKFHDQLYFMEMNRIYWGQELYKKLENSPQIFIA
jgi:hypothetical protein